MVCCRDFLLTWFALAVVKLNNNHKFAMNVTNQKNPNTQKQSRGEPTPKAVTLNIASQMQVKCKLNTQKQSRGEPTTKADMPVAVEEYRAMRREFRAALLAALTMEEQS